MRAQQVFQLTPSAHFTVDAKFNLSAPELKTFPGFSTAIEAFSNQTGARTLSKQRTNGLNEYLTRDVKGPGQTLSSLLCVPIPTSYDRNTSWNPFLSLHYSSGAEEALSSHVRLSEPLTSEVSVSPTSGGHATFPLTSPPPPINP